MSWLDDNMDIIMMDEYLHQEAVEEYIEDKSDHTLILEATRILAVQEVPDELREKIVSISSSGIKWGRLTPNQKYALGDFVYIHG